MVRLIVHPMRSGCQVVIADTEGREIGGQIHHIALIDWILHVIFK